MTKDVSKITDIAIKLNLITADDICQYSVVELVYKIINKVNEVIEVIGIQNDDIQSLLNDGMPEEVMAHFNKILADGTLETFINQTVLANINQKVNQTDATLKTKVTVNQPSSITSVMLSQEVKEQMTGGSVAVVGKNAVLNENIANGQVTREKTNFYDYSLDGNLVNDLTVTKGKGYYSNGTAVETGLTSMITIHKSDLNFVDGIVKIRYNRPCEFAFWGKQKEFISGYYGQHVDDNQTADITNIPTTADYVTITFPSTDIDSIVICKSENYVTGLKPIYIDDNLLIKPDQLLSGIDVAKIADFKLNPQGNLISRLNTVKGYYYWFEDGSKRVSPNDYTVSYPLDVTKTYVINFDTVVTYWDENGQFISGRPYGSLSGTTNTEWITPDRHPSNAKEIRVVVYGTDHDIAVFAEKDFFKKDLKTSYYIEGLVEDSKVSGYLSSNPLNNKKAVFLGDSWCAGNAEGGGGWCQRIKESNPTLTVVNYGQHGADWAQGNLFFLDVEEKMAEIKSSDYVIIEAYTNGLYGDVSGLSKSLGSIDEFTYMSLEQIEALPDTYAKDLEKFMFRIASECHGKKIGLMFPYKSVDHLRENNAFRQFRPEVIKCANKYNIPIFDNFNGCNIPSWDAELRKDYYFQNDGCHLNGKGYDIITPPIEKWIKTL